jgi:hypothetical protein
VLSFEKCLSEFVQGGRYGRSILGRQFHEWIMFVKVDLSVAEVARLEMPPDLRASLAGELSLLTGNEFE